MNAATSIRTPFSLLKSFFVDAALAAIEERWHLMVELAWKGQGLTVDLTQVPHWILEKIPEWHSALVEESNRETRGQ